MLSPGWGPRLKAGPVTTLCPGGRDLGRFNTAAARENDRFFEQISSQAQVIAGYTAEQYARQGSISAPSVCPRIQACSYSLVGNMRRS